VWIALLAMVAAASPAVAQTAGTVAVSGSVAAAFKMTSGGPATITGGGTGAGVTTSSGVDAALATVVSFGNVGPGNTNPMVCFTQPLLLRANAASDLSAAVTSATFGTGAADVSKSDIGIGLVNLAAGGPNADVSTTSVGTVFADNPCTATLDADGIPSFTGTLADLATAAPGTDVITSTGAISRRGSFNSPNNAANLDLKLAVAPQAFTAGTFSATVTFTLGTP
jgi:hypothetical protein